MGTLNLTRNLKFLLFFLIVFLFSSCSRDEIESEPAFEANLSADSKRTVKDQYIVLLSKKPGKNDPRAGAAMDALSKEVGNMNGARVRAKFQNSVTGFVAKLNPQQVEKLRKDKRVISVTADSFVDLASSPATNSAVVQEYPTWGLDRMDQRAALLDRAYSYNSTGSGVTKFAD